MASPDVGVTAVSYQFLPWVRRGLTVALSTADTFGVLPSRAVAQVGVKLAAPLDGTAFAPVSMQLYGPGDVIGIDTGLVVRTDPKPNAHNFEPNYLAIIDFDPPDFPWILTPAKANDRDQLRPWLVLVVLEVAKTGLPRMQPQALMPSIRVKVTDVATELPDLGDSWSWAHAQVVSQATDAASLQSDLQGKPASNVSRLVCPRRLSESTNYVACLVPAFEPGRLRGLGLAGDQDPAMQTIAPAWNRQAVADVVLPVYFWWEFSTSAAGDFESLARRLKTPSAYRNTPLADALGAVGTSPMSVDSVLSGEDPVALETMEGALVPIKYTPGGRPKNDVQAESLMAIVNTPQDQVVDPVGDDGLNHAGARLEVKPQVVGGWHIKQQSVQMDELGQHWIADLNLGPRYRGAAGYGAEIVRQNQEEYVDAAWDQIGQILEADRRMNRTRLAIEAQLAIRRKHLDKLPAERLLQVMGPALPRIEALSAADVAYRINGRLASLGGQLDRSSLPAALLDTAMRRTASPQRRALRMAARMKGTMAVLPALAQRYVGAMAAATTKAPAFEVNAFTPDGVVGTRLFNGLDLAGNTVDLSPIGLGAAVSTTRVREIVDAGHAAQRQLAAAGVPPLKIRAGQSKGVFTDAHVDRFGTLASNAPGVRASDWGVVASAVETLGRRGVEGFLVEADTAKATLQFSSMRLDARSGALHLDRALLRLDAARRALKPVAPVRRRGPLAAVAGVNLGRVNVTDARQFNNAGLFASLPVNALQTAPGAGTPTFVLDQGFEFAPLPVPAAPAAGITLTLPPAIRTRTVLNRFAAATRGTQALWRDGFEASHVELQPVDFGVASAAAIVRVRTDPTLTLPARLRSLVSIAGDAASNANFFVGRYLAADDLAAQQRFMIPALFDRVMAWPKLTEALYQALAGYDKQAFMPGVDDIPEDMIMLVKVNPFFIDAFMVGANHEMNRELLWRGFPTDLRGTPFQRFWGRTKVVEPRTTVLLDDMQPIHQWGAQPLGRRVDAVGGDPDRVALLVKGQLLRRYPNTAVYAWRRRAQPSPPLETQLAKNADGSAAAGAVKIPDFAGVIAPDITFFGFDIQQADIGNWCFVLEEQMSEPRFGFDVGDPVPGQPSPHPGFGPQPRRALADQLELLAALSPADYAKQDYNPWKALSWNHVGVSAGNYASVQALQDVAAPFASFPALGDHPTAAQIAKALLQQPFRAYYLGDDLVP